MKKGNAEEAVQQAVKWGQKTERTYFGLWVSGVYSNADLYANYAGMKFYDALTQPLTVGGESPAGYRSSGKWPLENE